MTKIPASHPQPCPNCGAKLGPSRGGPNTSVYVQTQDKANLQPAILRVNGAWRSLDIGVEFCSLECLRLALSEAVAGLEAHRHPEQIYTPTES